MQTTAPDSTAVCADSDSGGRRMDRLRRATRKFARRCGRRPRILICCADAAGRGRMARASALADMGFDVDIVKRFQTPEDLARTAVENDDHAIDLGGPADLGQEGVLRLLKALQKESGGDIRVVVDGFAVPEQGAPLLRSGAVIAVDADAPAAALAARLLAELETIRPG